MYVYVVVELKFNDVKLHKCFTNYDAAKDYIYKQDNWISFTIKTCEFINDGYVADTIDVFNGVKDMDIDDINIKNRGLIMLKDRFL